MKAIVVYPPKKDSLQLAEVPKPAPKDNEALLEPLCVGIDGTDVEINEGIYGDAPRDSDFLVLGHEALARVHETGGEVKGFSKGELVVPTVRRPCEENCLNCRNRESDMCLTGNYFEHGIRKLHGFASEYAVSNADYLVKVPSDLRDVAVLLEPLSISEKAVVQSFRIQERMRWEPERAFVVGAGSLGLLASMLLRLRGLEVYVAATRGKESLKARIISGIGGTYINVKETPINALKEKFDIIIEATGKPDVAIETIRLLGPNGVMCFLGIYRETIACEDFGRVLTNMVLGNKLMFGSVNSNKKHFELGIKHMGQIKEKYGGVLEKLITKRVDVKDYRQAFIRGKEDIKTIICFEHHKS